MKVRDERKGKTKETLGSFFERKIKSREDNLRVVSTNSGAVGSWEIKNYKSQIADEWPPTIGIIPAGNPNSLILYGDYFSEFFQKLIREYEREVKPYDDVILIIKDDSEAPIPKKMPWARNQE